MMLRCRRNLLIRRTLLAIVAASALTVAFICYYDVVLLDNMEVNAEMERRRLSPVRGVVDRLRISADDDSEMALRMKQRRERIAQVCRKYSLGLHQLPHTGQMVKHPPSPQYEAFYFDRVRYLAFCPIYKAASSSWLTVLATLNNVTLEYLENSGKQLSDIARSVVPSIGGTKAIQAMAESLRFMIVRHPFERILSAYRDKLESRRDGVRHGTEHFYQTYGRKIVSRYRDPRIHPELKDREEPTFPEFVQYLIDTDLVQRADDHWIPYYLFCTPCWVDYDVIAKFETLDEDLEFLIDVAGLGGRGVRPPWKHLTKGVQTKDVDSAYFAQITKEQVLQLHQKFKLDFDLFDYDYDRYFTIAR